MRGREEAAEDRGDDANEGHQERIDKLRDGSQILGHSLAHGNGEYEYQTEGMQDVDEDLRRELESENDGKILERWEYNRAVEGGYVEEGEGEPEEEEPEEEDSDMDIVSDSG